MPGLKRQLNNGNNINVNYQMRNLNRAYSNNVILNHLQLIRAMKL